jgi:hypothetical protein
MGKNARFSPGLMGRDCVSDGRVVLPHQGRDNPGFMEDNSEKYWFWRKLHEPIGSHRNYENRWLKMLGGQPEG